MIVAQFAIPLAAGAATLAAAGFALNALLRSRTGASVTAAAGGTRARTRSFLWRFLAMSLAAALVAGAGVGATGAVYREGIAEGVLAAAAVAAGALTAAGVAAAGAALGGRASEQAATAAGRALRRALAITLQGGAAPALAGGALAIAGIGGLYGLATRLDDVPGGEAAFLALGAGAGAALTALTARLLAASEPPADEEAEEDARAEQAAREAAAGGAETIALTATGAAAGLVAGAPIAALTDDGAWLVAPLVVMAFGLAAATLGAITLPLWTRALRNAGRAVAAGYGITATLAGALAFATPLLLLEEGRWWFAGTALTGVAMSALVFAAGRTLIGEGTGYRGSGAAFALLAGAALIAAFVFGRQAGIAGVSPTAVALYGVTMAAAGALALAPMASAVRWFGAGAATALALAERAREAAPPPAEEEAPPALSPGPLLGASRRALAPAWVHGFAGTALVGALTIAALLLAARTELANVAVEDTPRFVQLAADLGVAPRSEAILADAAHELAAYLDLLDRHDLADAAPSLIFAEEAETRRILELRARAEGRDEDWRTIDGSPWPFPALPPLRIDGMAATGALIGLGALLGAIGITEAGRRRAWARTLAALLTAGAAPVAAALIAQTATGGNAGWELAAGAALAALVAGLALAARGRGKGASAEAGLALAVWLGAAGAAIAPALLAA